MRNGRWSHLSCRHNRGGAGRSKILARSSRACSGASRPASPGAISRRATARGKPSTAAWPTGSAPASGPGASRRCARCWMTRTNAPGTSGASRARTSAPTRPPRARPPPAHGPPGEPADHALGRSRGGFGLKLHLAGDGPGLPWAIVLSPGQAHEARYVEPVLNAVRIPRRVAGRPRQRPGQLAGDRGYSLRRIRAWVRAPHSRPTLPERSAPIAHRHGRPPTFDRDAYRRREPIGGAK